MKNLRIYLVGWLVGWLGRFYGISTFVEEVQLVYSTVPADLAIRIYLFIFRKPGYCSNFALFFFNDN